MKKHLFTTLALAFIGIATQAQTQDRPYVIHAAETTPAASLSDDKSGSLGQLCSYSVNAQTVSATNGQNGVMFKVKAKEDIYINGFSLVPEDANAQFTVYKKGGTYVGSEGSSGNWTLVGDVTLGPSGVMQVANINPDMFVTAGSEASFYITSVTGSASLRYENGTTEGAIYSQNSDIIFYEGIGVQGSFGTTFTPRVMSGAVHYCKSSEFTCDTIASPKDESNGNAGIFFDVKAKHNDITIDNIFSDLTPFGSDVLRIYTKTGTSVGSETNAAAWTLLDTTVLTNPANASLQSITDGINLTIPANSIQGFHLVFAQGNMGVDYGNGTAIGDTLRSEPYMAIMVGSGADGVFQTNALPRNFSGLFSFCVAFAGVEENEAIEFNLYPNPTTDYITLNSANTTISEIIVTDVSGKTIMTLGANGANTSHTIDVSHLATGSYFVKVVGQNGISTKKFIKQ